uniref:Uncharacterized protein n=1 Tax=Rhizophagus irregularis (strain DAOM 181602 / DAOM 197198 / MUCL 43194) TaxID=747089 RepID=U9V062_RHIID
MISVMDQLLIKLIKFGKLPLALGNMISSHFLFVSTTPYPHALFEVPHPMIGLIGES